MNTPDEVFSAALALADRDRALLAERLLASLNQAQQAEIEAAWHVEIDRRIEQIEKGEAKLIPGDVVMNMLRPGKS